MRKIFIMLSAAIFLLCFYGEASAQSKTKTKKKTSRKIMAPSATLSTLPKLKFPVTPCKEEEETSDPYSVPAGTNPKPPKTTIKPCPTTGITTPLKITSKPKANYTDEARDKQVAGRVVLKVTFNANGTISNVTPVSTLPYGLTEQAKAAARSIRFEPAKKNGVSVTVTKAVEYIFTLY